MNNFETITIISSGFNSNSSSGGSLGVSDSKPKFDPYAYRSWTFNKQMENFWYQDYTIYRSQLHDLYNTLSWGMSRQMKTMRIEII